MKRYFAAILVAVSFFVLLALISKSAASPNQAVFITPTPPIYRTSSLLYLDRVELKIPAPSGYRCREECDEDMIINVIARGINVEEKKNVYKYKVSGGRILDEGKNVRWDLSDARPGTYTITVSVGDGEKTKEETGIIIVKDCDCEGFCACPTISVNGERNVKGGENVAFSAQVSGGTAAAINYSWTVSQGEIIAGQGTPEIIVKTLPGMTGSVKATVEISGELCADCARTASAITEITK
jgi:hypothetical protein